MRLRCWPLVVALVLSLTVSCSSGEASPQPTKPSVDYHALQDAVENKITTGSVSLDNVRAVLVSVDGQTRLSHYRHGFTATDTTHVQSVTKSVMSTLIGIAIGDGIIGGLDQTLAELLPQHTKSMPSEVRSVTLRQLMTMSAGFDPNPPEESVRRIFAENRDLVAYLLKRCHSGDVDSEFVYSNVGSHLVAAVLAAALQRADGRSPRSVLDYARQKLFDPLGINTRPAFTKPELDDSEEFGQAQFGWLTDPQGISIGAFGLRLTAPDLLKIGELYLGNGVWRGRQIVPADWVRQVTTPSKLEPQYGLMWWLFTWNGHKVYAARGAEGHLIVVVPDQKAVITISSANRQEYPMDDEALFPLVNELIIPTLDGS